VEELLAERGIEVDQRLRGRTNRGTTERGSRHKKSFCVSMPGVGTSS